MLMRILKLNGPECLEMSLVWVVLKPGSKAWTRVDAGCLTLAWDDLLDTRQHEILRTSQSRWLWTSEGS